MGPALLIVDDNPNNLRSMEALLSDLGGDLTLASSGQAALLALLKQDYALILLDVQMPELDGYETARLIRERERSRSTPIIFVTAHHNTDEAVTRAYALGAVDFLFKPVVGEILKAKVQVFLDLHRKTEELRGQTELLRAAQQRELERSLAAQKVEFERKRLEDEAARHRELRLVLEKNAAELREADRRKDEFIAMLGHELRNPLTPIQNSLEVLRVRAGEDELARRSIEAADRQVRHVVRLVDDLLDVSRITRDKVELRRQHVRVGPLIDQAIGSVEPLVRAKRHLLETQLPWDAEGSERSPVVDVDPNRFVQVIANLLGNAAKYTPEGGRIRLDVEVSETDLRVVVSDDGIGIPPDMLGRIFDVFVQAAPSADRADAGLGIGLTLAQRLARLHGGNIDARSEGPGKGSTFVLQLPSLVVGGEAAEPASRPAPEASASGSLRVLLVEDNADVRETLKDLLGLHGHDVHEAPDGPEGVRRLQELEPDVALIDIGLPGMDGYRVATEAKKARPGLRTHLIALTGFGTEEDRKRALEAGFDAHLSKPVTFEDLIAVFTRLRQPETHGENPRDTHATDHDRDQRTGA